MMRRVLTCWLWVSIAIVGCAAESRVQSEQVAHRATAEVPTTQSVADSSDVWLAQARTAHAFADAALTEGRADDAKRRLRELAELSMTGASRGAEQVKQVRRATFARLAEIDLATAPQQALLAAQSGLALDERPDLITAELRFWRGRAYEALGDTSAAEREFALCRDAAKALSSAQ